MHYDRFPLCFIVLVTNEMHWMPCCRADICVSCDVEVGFTDTNCPCCSALISRGMAAMQGQTVSWEAIEANCQANDDLRLVMILEQSD